MSNTSPQNGSHIVDDIFAKLNQRDLEQFYASYQRWHLQQQVATLQTCIDDLYLQIFDITERMQAAQPSAIALATLARLQANGVNDVELLDRMLERGENWLDQTMQQLDYCEQLDDFIRDDYTQWCRHALEGAYDWIGSIQDTSAPAPAEEPIEEEQVEATAELFLQKLSSDEDEDEASMLETTLKRPAVTLSSSEESAPIPVVADTPAAAEAISLPAEPEPAPVVEETSPGDAIPASDSDAVQASPQESANAVEESHQVEVSPASEALVESAAEPEHTDVIDDSFTQPAGVALQAGLEQTDVPIEQESVLAIEETSLEETAPLIEEHIPATEESPAVDDISSGAIQEDAQPVTEEDTRPVSEEHVPVSESESTMQEHDVLEESPPVESDSPSAIEQPAIQESVEIAPAQEEPSVTSPEPAQQIEEPVPSEAPAAESEKLEANVQASVPQEGEPHPQNTVVPKRPNFIMRILKTIWC